MNPTTFRHPDTTKKRLPLLPCFFLRLLLFFLANASLHIFPVSPLKVSAWADTEPAAVSIIVEKIWDDKEDQDGIRPESVTFHLLRNGTEIACKSVTASDGWACAFTGLPMTSPNGKPIPYTVTESAISGYTLSLETEETMRFDQHVLQKDIVYRFTDKHIPLSTDIPVTVSWNDALDHDHLRPDAITIRLCADEDGQNDPESGSRMQACITARDGWRFLFHDLPSYSHGKIISYHIMAESVPSGYDVAVSGDPAAGFRILYQHQPAEPVSADSSEMTTVSGSILWDDHSDQDGLRPDSAELQLLAEGTVIARKQVRADTAWFYAFENLPRFSSGKEISYGVRAEAFDGYRQDSRAFHISYHHEPETIQIRGQVRWLKDSPGLRPGQMVVCLLSNGMETASVLVSEKNGWNYTFSELPKYSQGQEISYELVSQDIPGYETEVSDFMLENEYLYAEK